MRHLPAVLAVSLVLAVVPTTPGAAALEGAPSTGVLLRVDQAGYVARQDKFAILMARHSLGQPRVYVLNRDGDRVATATVRRRVGWSRSYPAVFGVDFASVNRPGRYRLALSGTSVRSPEFSVLPTGRLW